MAYRQQNKKPQLPKEEYAIVLDVVPSQNSFKDDEIIQAIGTTNYTLLELVPKKGAIVSSGDRVYIGEGKRDEIQYIKRGLFPDKLSGGSKSEILFTIMDIVDEREEEYINFFNRSGPITIRKHSLELIPGIGKKHLKDLLNEREEKPFENFKDISCRCQFLPDPSKSISERILDEIEKKDDIKIFIRR